MTIDDLRNSTKDFLSPTEVGKIPHSDPQSIRVTARQRPELIGYPLTFSGNRMKIPRIGFLSWLTQAFK